MCDIRIYGEVFNIQPAPATKEFQVQNLLPRHGQNRAQSATQNMWISRLLHSAAGSSATAGPTAKRSHPANNPRRNELPKSRDRLVNPRRNNDVFSQTFFYVVVPIFFELGCAERFV